MPGENIYAWSTTASANGNADTLINWQEGMPRASVNDSARGQMAAIAKNRNLQNGSIVTTGTPNVQIFESGMEFFDPPPAGMRVLLKIGPDLTNTGSTTLAIDSTAAVTIKRQNGSNLEGEELRAGGYADLVYDGTNWILLRETATGFGEPLPLPPIDPDDPNPPVLPGPAPVPAGPDLISTTTAAGSAAIHITGFDASYDEYRLVITEVTASTINTMLCMRAAVGGSPVFISGSTDYSWTNFRITSAAASLVTGDINDSEIQLTEASVGILPGFPVAGELRIYSPGSTRVTTSFQWTLSFQNGPQTAYLRHDGAGRVNPVYPTTALEFYFSPISGLNTILTGTFQLYGLRK